MFQIIKNIWQAYGATTVSLVLYWFAIIWLLIIDKKKENKKLLILAILMPIVIGILQGITLIFRPEHEASQLIFLFPIGIVLCFVATCIIGQGEAYKGVKKTWITILIYGIIIQSGVNLKYSADVLQGGLNQYKISPTVCHLAEFITEDHELRDPYVLAPNEISTQIQEYDPQIRVYFHDGFEYSAFDLNIVKMQMDQTGCNCVIVPLEQDIEEFWKEAGYRMIVIFDGYSVYARI